MANKIDRSEHLPKDVVKAISGVQQKQIGLPKNPYRRAKYVESLKEYVEDANTSPVIRMQKMADAFLSAQPGSGSLRAVRPKQFDPLESPTNRGIPYYSYTQARDHDDVVKKARAWCRYFYISHNLVPSAIDIMARFPLVGVQNYCPDEKVQEFFDELFFDDLDYEQKLIDVGLEYWKVGEVFPFAEWADDLGVWVSEELLNPDQIIVHRTTFPRMEAYQMDVDDHLYEVITTNKYPFEKQAIELNLPGIIDNIKSKNPIGLPTPNIYSLQQLADPWANRGTPLLMRAFRQLMLEERLNRAQAAISERLFTPFILITLGLQNVDGQGTPWIPNFNDLNRTQTIFENLMESDYRTLVHHLGIDIKVPLSGERMPNLSNDYDRIENSILQVFGISRDLLNGGRSQSYASTALSAEFLMQRLNTYQAHIKKFVRSRYEKVSEAQGFYEYEGPIFNRTPKVVRQLIVHENGVKEVVERNKLMVPDTNFQTMDFRDEKAQREFLAQLKSAGLPISGKTMTRGVKWDIKEESQTIIQEEVEKALLEARTKVAIKKRLAEEGLAGEISPETIDERAEENVDPAKTLVPGMSGQSVGPVDETGGGVGDSEQTPQRPEVSDSYRSNMPTSASLQKKYGENLGVVSGFENLGKVPSKKSKTGRR